MPTDAVLLPRSRSHEHVVGLYDTDAFLIESVADYLSPAFEDADAIAIVVATPEHRLGIAAELSHRGFVLSADRYVELDADTTLASITRDGDPDAARFRSQVGAFVDRHADAGRTAYVFGEMVKLMWQAGNVTGALELEQLWDELVSSAPVALYCAYHSEVLADAGDDVAFRAICDAHSRVMPRERDLSSVDPTEARDDVSTLRQQVIAGAKQRARLQRHNDELRAALDRWEEAERLRERFSAMVVHDLRNPVSVIVAVLDLLGRSWTDLQEEQINECLTAAERGTVQIQRLIDDLLLMGRLGCAWFTYDLQPVDLHSVVTEQALVFRDLTGRTMEVSAPEQLPLAYGDEGRQRQILSNLLSNATRFSDEATAVTIHLEAQAGRIVVRVQDRGCGIAATDLPLLFEPFSPVSERSGKGGTGLGLSITKALVEGQGGTIDVTSAPGGGTTFSYTVPTSPDGAQRAEPERPRDETTEP